MLVINIREAESTKQTRKSTAEIKGQQLFPASHFKAIAHTLLQHKILFASLTYLIC